MKSKIIIAAISLSIVTVLTSCDEHDYVDLDLPSGTLWATCNIGASNPEDYGYFYSWGEVYPKRDYDWSTYKWCNGTKNSLTKYCSKPNCGAVDYVYDLDDDDDAAIHEWGSKWKMPTQDQFRELYRECYWVWTNSYKGSNVSGFIVYKAKNANLKGVKVLKNDVKSVRYSEWDDTHIFFPAGGLCLEVGYGDFGRSGGYWSRSLCVPAPNGAFYLSLDDNSLGIRVDEMYRYIGYSVRPVRNPEYSLFSIF